MIDGNEERYETEEQVGTVVAQYQLDHPEDPDLARIVIRRGGGGDTLDPQQFLPQQIP